MFNLPLGTFLVFFIICPGLILAWLLWWGFTCR